MHWAEATLRLWSSGAGFEAAPYEKSFLWGSGAGENLEGVWQLFQQMREVAEEAQEDAA